ncbi:MAG: flagellar biosynthesis anti-sigma factor FlgM [Syntrophobacterales bacterium]|jgi:negative regulator of flagellin synthesis FlgM|nr:flagellar biosynthesis anti-sigma factor FlgM [Syntrophobacterales bacterium]
MKISGNNNAAIPLIQQYQKQENIRQETQGKSIPVETVGLSNEAKEAYAISKISQTLDDVRMDKVKELKGLIDAGTYDVSGEKIAGKIMKEALYDILA